MPFMGMVSELGADRMSHSICLEQAAIALRPILPAPGEPS